MTRISVVVPIYNVEAYLQPCLRSIAAQTFTDLDVVMVDDGSTDGSGRIADEFASGDERFRLVRQANGGLSSARNTGIEESAGEFLAFVDSDDVLPADAYERLLGALDETGSDFATGNVHRLDGAATTQAPFLARAFARTRLRTHVTRFRPLLADRTAWNKLYRRSFWDRHGYRFPEGRLYEDIPVTLPAHFAARAVDVLADPVYFWRVRRSGGEQSITQRRLEQRALLDRLAAIEEVRDHLARNGPRRGLRWYEQSAVADDLRLYLDLLDEADDDYRALFLERSRRFRRARRPRRDAPAPGDRPAQVAPRARAQAAGADRGPALPEARSRRHAADPDPRPLVRRLPVPRRPRARHPTTRLPARARGPRPCAHRARGRRGGRRRPHPCARPGLDRRPRSAARAARATDGRPARALAAPARARRRHPADDDRNRDVGLRGDAGPTRADPRPPARRRLGADGRRPRGWPEPPALALRARGAARRPRGGSGDRRPAGDGGCRRGGQDRGAAAERMAGGTPSAARGRDRGARRTTCGSPAVRPRSSSCGARPTRTRSPVRSSSTGTRGRRGYRATTRAPSGSYGRAPAHGGSRSRSSAATTR